MELTDFQTSIASSTAQGQYSRLFFSVGVQSLALQEIALEVGLCGCVFISGALLFSDTIGDCMINTLHG